MRVKGTKQLLLWSAVLIVVGVLALVDQYVELSPWVWAACLAAAGLAVASKHSAVIPALRVLIGLDGFVDEIISVVDQRESDDRYTRVPTLAAFAARIARAAGKSTQAELVVERVKLGGNGPIMANALIMQGHPCTYIGAIGKGEIHPLFADFAASCVKVISMCEPAYTQALEFEDGKLMISDTSIDSPSMGIAIEGDLLFGFGI